MTPAHQRRAAPHVLKRRADFNGPLHCLTWCHIFNIYVYFFYSSQFPSSGFCHSIKWDEAEMWRINYMYVVPLLFFYVYKVKITILEKMFHQCHQNIIINIQYYSEFENICSKFCFLFHFKIKLHVFNLFDYRRV